AGLLFVRNSDSEVYVGVLIGLPALSNSVCV
ncbi:hypothetical protein LCGC14_2901420, partial [marine sediment metagenome]